MSGYAWIKVVHVLAVISWMAGLLYLPRLFVYHSEVGVDSEAGRVFQVMERRLLRAIMHPAAIVAWMSGIWLAVSGELWVSGWFHGKLAMLFALSATHLFLAAERVRIESKKLIRTSRFYRIINEVPTLLMVVIVILVIGKPF